MLTIANQYIPSSFKKPNFKSNSDVLIFFILISQKYVPINPIQNSVFQILTFTIKKILTVYKQSEILVLAIMNNF